MEIIAKSKHIRLTPRKLRLVADLVRGLSLAEALTVLESINKRAARPILLTLRQGLGNAVNNFDLEQDSLRIKEIQIQEGPTLKRWRAASRGRAHTIFKRSSHLRIVLKGKKLASVKKPKETKEKKKPALKNKRRKGGSKS